jgi:SAM-dependent methyltransferase
MLRIEFNPQSTKCIFCGSDKLRKFKAKASDSENPSLVNIVECEDCMFGWQYPLGRTDQESVQHFEECYSDGGRTKSDYFDEKNKRAIAELELDFIETLPSQGRNLLDIGAGAGIFAEVVAQNDWTVTAVDPALELSRLNNNSNINAIKGTTSQIPSGTLFDVISMWDVVEHVTNPAELINDAASYLKEGGWLVLETGNYKSADRVYEGTSHWIYQLDHRWYFSPESLEWLLTDLGFSEFIFSKKVLRPNWSGSVGYAGPSRVNIFKTIAKDPLRLRTHISKFITLTQSKEWKMPGIGIFAIAARMPNK